MAIAVAVALHNIPEGISVSVPIYYATGNRKKNITQHFDLFAKIVVNHLPLVNVLGKLLKGNEKRSNMGQP